MGTLKKGYLPNYTYNDYIYWELIYGNAYAINPLPMFYHQSISTDEIQCKAEMDFDFVYERFQD